MTATLVVFGGLPGTGKTTIARALAARRGAVYLRIDAIEQAMRSSGGFARDVGAAGYAVAQAVAISNLELGLSVVADCVNPVPQSRDGWRAAAARAGCPLLEAEVVCSDRVEHRRRVESRTPDIEGLLQPSWDDVMARVFAPWPEPHLVIDTAPLSPGEAVDLMERHMAEKAR